MTLRNWIHKKDILKLTHQGHVGTLYVSRISVPCQENLRIAIFKCWC